MKSLLEKLDKIRPLIGNTPLIELPLQGSIQLFAKLEFYNLIGSVKDRPAFDIIKAGILDGKISSETVIIESSSGNFASAAAVICKTLKLKFVAVIDPTINQYNEDFLKLNCWKVEKVSTRDNTGGFLKTRLEKVKALSHQYQNSFWTNQYENVEGMRSHYSWLGTEICKEMDHIDFAFMGVSSGGTISGVSQRIKEMYPRARIIAVDAEGSVIFGGNPKKRNIPGIGSSISPGLIRHAHIDEPIYVSEKETIQGCHKLLEVCGIFAGGSSGSVYFAANSYLSKKMFEKQLKAVMIFPDRGNSYMNTIYNKNWNKPPFSSQEVKYAF